MKSTYPIAFLFFSLIAFSQIDRSIQPLPTENPKINFKLPVPFELDNGLKVYLIENHKRPKVSVYLKTDNPMMKSQEDKVGMGSLLNAMLGNGTQSISKEDYNKRIDYLGATLSLSIHGGNAVTLSRYFPEILQLFADGIINPLLTEKELIKEREKRLKWFETNKKSIETVGRRVEDALMYTTNHPYGQFITPASLKNITLENIVELHKKRLIPNNAYLIIEGDIEVKKALRLIKKHFGIWQRTSIQKSEIITPENPESTHVCVVNMPETVQSRITVQNLVSVRMNAPDYFAIILANNILGGGSESFLFNNLREDKGYTYGSYSSIGNNKNTKSTFRAYADVRTQVTDSAVVEILKEIQKIRTELVTERTLTMSKTKCKGNLIRNMGDSKFLASFVFKTVTEHLPKDFYSNYFNGIDAVTIDDIKRVANEHFRVKQAQIVITGNIDKLEQRIENIFFDGKKIPVFYYDRYAKPLPRDE